MSQLIVFTNPSVQTVYENYPKNVNAKVQSLRGLILGTANAIQNLTELEETLKWGEPSFIAKKGSTIRIAWSAKKPDQYGIYFQCSSNLVSTFKMIYKNVFKFEGNRAIIFTLNETPPKEALKSCIKAALTYHTVKHLPTLGI